MNWLKAFVAPFKAEFFAEEYALVAMHKSKQVDHAARVAIFIFWKGHTWIVAVMGEVLRSLSPMEIVRVLNGV